MGNSIPSDVHEAVRTSMIAAIVRRPRSEQRESDSSVHQRIADQFDLRKNANRKSLPAYYSMKYVVTSYWINLERYESWQKNKSKNASVRGG